MRAPHDLRFRFSSGSAVAAVTPRYANEACDDVR